MCLPSLNPLCQLDSLYHFTTLPPPPLQKLKSIAFLRVHRRLFFLSRLLGVFLIFVTSAQRSRSISFLFITTSPLHTCTTLHPVAGLASYYFLSLVSRHKSTCTRCNGYAKVDPVHSPAPANFSSCCQTPPFCLAYRASTTASSYQNRERVLATPRLDINRTTATR